jgi:hypothetical protein
MFFNDRWPWCFSMFDHDLCLFQQCCSYMMTTCFTYIVPYKNLWIWTMQFICIVMCFSNGVVGSPPPARELHIPARVGRIFRRPRKPRRKLRRSLRRRRAEESPSHALCMQLNIRKNMQTHGQRIQETWSTIIKNMVTHHQNTLSKSSKNMVNNHQTYGHISFKTWSTLINKHGQTISKHGQQSSKNMVEHHQTHCQHHQNTWSSIV